MAELRDGQWVDSDPNVKHPSRADYLAGRVTFEEYYRAIAKESGVSFRNSPMLPKVARALANGDEHLNTIRLAEWDSIGIMGKSSTAPVFKAHGDFWSIAGGCCVAKQAAKDAAMESVDETKEPYGKPTYRQEQPCLTSRAILKACGVPIGADFFTLSSSQVCALLEYAKGYRKPKNANGSKGRYWHAKLQREAQRVPISDVLRSLYPERYKAGA